MGNSFCLIWVQPVCKDYQQTTKVAASKERVKPTTVGSGKAVFCEVYLFFAESAIMFFKVKNLNIYAHIILLSIKLAENRSSFFMLI